jgi:hypothetical protein
VLLLLLLLCVFRSPPCAPASTRRCPTASSRSLAPTVAPAAQAASASGAFTLLSLCLCLCNVSLSVAHVDGLGVAGNESNRVVGHRPHYCANCWVFLWEVAAAFGFDRDCGDVDTDLLLSSVFLPTVSFVLSSSRSRRTSSSCWLSSRRSPRSKLVFLFSMV